MADIDRQAAKKELKEASELREKAEQLVTIAGELENEAARHEKDAEDLIAPPRASSTPRRRG